MKTKNSFLSKHPYLPFVFLFLFMVVRHALTRTGMGDDSWFLAESEKGLWDFTITRIRTWSSRNLIEAVLLILLNCSRWFWNIIDSLMFVLCAYSVEKILSPVPEKRATCTVLITLLLILFPFDILSTAGYYATSINYIWPLGLFLYVLSVFMRHVYKEKTHTLTCILAVFGSVFAANQEQLCALMVGFIGLYIIYFGFIRHSHIPAYMYVIFLITLLMLGYHAFCPGNAARKVTETAAYYPAYETFTIPDKIVLGITSTISYGLLKPFYIVFFFNIALLINIYRKKRINLDFIIMSGFTIVNLAISVSGTPRLRWLLHPLFYIFEPFTCALDSIPYSSMRLYAVILYFIVFTAFIIYLLRKYQKTPVFILTGIILAAAFCARILLGFSASVHESGMRTFINSFILIITAGLFCLFPDRFNEHIQKQE